MSEDFDDESFYDLYHEKIGHIPFLDTCVTLLNGQKNSLFKDGMKSVINNIDFILKSNQNQIDFTDNFINNFNISHWLFEKASGEKYENINLKNQDEIVKIYNTIYDFTVKDMIKHSLNLWLDLNKKESILPKGISNYKDFFKNKNKDMDTLAHQFFNFIQFGVCGQAIDDTNGLRKVVSLKKSFMGNWSREKWYYK